MLRSVGCVHTSGSNILPPPHGTIQNTEKYLQLVNFQLASNTAHRRSGFLKPYSERDQKRSRTLWNSPI